jgi:hypothetical protein
MAMNTNGGFPATLYESTIVMERTMRVADSFISTTPKLADFMRSGPRTPVFNSPTFQHTTVAGTPTILCQKAHANETVVIKSRDLNENAFNVTRKIQIEEEAERKRLVKIQMLKEQEAAAVAAQLQIQMKLEGLLQMNIYIGVIDVVI